MLSKVLKYDLSKVKLSSKNIILILLSSTFITHLINVLLSSTSELWIENTFVFCTSVFVLEYFGLYFIILAFYFYKKNTLSKEILIVYSIHFQTWISFIFINFFVRYYFLTNSSFYNNTSVSTTIYSSNIIFILFLSCIWKISTPSFVNAYNISKKSIPIYVFSLAIHILSYIVSLFI